MRINRKIFDGSIAMLETDRHLKKMVGKKKKTWFTQYRPIAFAEKDILELFLLKMFKLNICYHITGSFASISTIIKIQLATILLKDVWRDIS